MEQTTQTGFNEAAGKIINLREWAQKTKALYATNLTFGEKVILYAIDKPFSVLAGTVMAIKLKLDEKAREELKSRTQDGTLGMYFDANAGTLRGAFYAESGYITYSCEHTPKIPGFPAYNEKTLRLSMQALAECKDHRNLAAFGRLKSAS